MKKILFPLFMLSIAVFFSACDTTTDPDPVATTGNVVIVSTPAGAQIWTGTTTKTNSGKVTPDTLKNLSGTSVTVTLKLTDYNDTTFTVPVTAGKTTTSSTITLSAKPLNLTTFNDILLYERAAPSPKLSGLILSTGTVIASSNNTADVYFDLDSLKSSHTRPPSSTPYRYTNFYNANAPNSDLTDGIDSPVYSSSLDTIWTSYGIKKIQTSYSFLYTDDLHYVKLKITATGGDTGPSDPDKWIKVSYKYNETQKDTRF